MYIKTFDGVAAIFCEEQDRPCTHPDGHELNPDRGALNGEYGSYCIHCSHYVGRVEYFSAANGAAEAQAYAQVMLGATGPVEVRPGAIAQAKLPIWADDIELGCTSYEGVE